MDFKINKEFEVDGKALRLISGAVHYFRIAPTHWERTLRNLQAMGANCVETYVPWNLHEPQPGQFNFSGLADIEQFLTLAQNLGLYLILRPSPYICAEWEFGGLPAWLLRDSNLRVRSCDKNYLTAVENYYQNLLPRLLPFQTTQGGNLLMMQLENEYGSFGADKTYLQAIADLLRQAGVEVPLFTSDGGWLEALEAGTLPHVLATVNFGSDAPRNFSALKSYQAAQGQVAPLMCMEFWDGWFNNWQEPVIRRSAQEAGQALREILQLGSVNFYMFQGGTNFGFFNGCSDAGELDKAQITSYDYDAPLTEWGYPTAKFFEFQRIIKEAVPEAKISAPSYPEIAPLGSFAVEEKVSLFAVLEDIAKKTVNAYPLPMEKLGQNFGYVLYRTKLPGKRQTARLKLLDLGDRAQLFINEKFQAQQDMTNFAEEIEVNLANEAAQLDILVENMGRNNYGPKLISPKQSKGIRGGVLDDLHYLADWTHYSLELADLSALDFSKGWQAQTPSFYRCKLELKEARDTFLDCRAFGKGVVFVNGKNLGRYWQLGPVRSLFIPDYFWRQGENEVIVFETEGRPITELKFCAAPIIDEAAQ